MSTVITFLVLTLVFLIPVLGTAPILWGALWQKISRRRLDSALRAAALQAQQDLAGFLQSSPTAEPTRQELVRVVLDERMGREVERAMVEALKVLGLGELDRVEYHPEFASVTLSNRNGTVRLACAFSTHAPAAAELAFRSLEGPVLCSIGDVRSRRLTILAEGLQLKMIPLPATTP